MITMCGFYYGRVDASLPVLLFLVHGSKPIGVVIDDLEPILLASDNLNGGENPVPAV